MRASSSSAARSLRSLHRGEQLALHGAQVGQGAQRLLFAQRRGDGLHGVGVVLDEAADGVRRGQRGEIVEGGLQRHRGARQAVAVGEQRARQRQQFRRRGRLGAHAVDRGLRIGAGGARRGTGVVAGGAGPIGLRQGAQVTGVGVQHHRQRGAGAAALPGRPGHVGKQGHAAAERGVDHAVAHRQRRGSRRRTRAGSPPCRSAPPPRCRSARWPGNGTPCTAPPSAPDAPMARPA